MLQYFGSKIEWELYVLCENA